MEQTENSDLDCDVVVVGAGNAALCAALAARDRGARVIVLEKAPEAEQGGNCPFTGGGFRFTHEGIADLRSLLDDPGDDDAARVSMAPYTADDFRDHLLEVTRGDADGDRVGVLVSQSRPTVEWMHAKGVKWELPAARHGGPGAPSVVPNSVGLSAYLSGPGLVRMLTTAARRAGIDILYETKMLSLLRDPHGRVRGLMCRDADGDHRVDAGGVVLACGGFEASPEMRTRYLGAGWERAKVRGSQHNTGDGHRAAMEIGAGAAGQWDGCHATPIDVRAPATGNLQVTDSMPRRSYPLGITVNRQGSRFFDEGEGFAEQTFVNAGRRILEQDGGVAFQIFDSSATGSLEPRYGSSSPVKADSIGGLAERLCIDRGALEDTVGAFNAKAHDGQYNVRELDGRSTRSLDPPKSNWAIKVDSPPFAAFAVTGGITYTYGGLKINTRAQAVDVDGKPIPGLFAAGEIVGGIFHHDSLRAAGLMHGAVFGRIAGANVALRD